MEIGYAEILQRDFQKLLDNVDGVVFLCMAKIGRSWKE